MQTGVHEDALATLDVDAPLRVRLQATHRALKRLLPFVERIAVAVYDPKTTILRTFVHSSGGDDPLPHYQARLDDVPSLRKLVEEKRPRVVNSLDALGPAESEHARRLGRSGYAASYTLPIFSNGTFFGFVFFDSRQPGVFDESALAQIDVFAHLVALMAVRELAAGRVLTAAIESARHMMHARDSETGNHLDRMSRFARLIARALADRHGLDDEYLERIQLFAPLHDIGKIGIPDAILLKSGRLTEEERTLMRTHSGKGKEIIEDLVANFGLASLKDAEFMRNIALHHHEFVDGNGYPDGLAGDEIPLEARIVAVADVFDALTTRRPYKEAFGNDKAFAMIEQAAGTHLDPECVRALIDNREEVERIQARFREEAAG